MIQNNDSNNVQSNDMNSTKTDQKPKAKPPKPEDKPFKQFIEEELIPALTQSLNKLGCPPNNIILQNGDRPVSGGKCWMVIGEISKYRRFWLCFDTDNITSNKTIAIAEDGSQPSILESFLIDEKKTTKALLVSRLLQRLNGQKWLGAN